MHYLEYVVVILLYSRAASEVLLCLLCGALEASAVDRCWENPLYFNKYTGDHHLFYSCRQQSTEAGGLVTHIFIDRTSYKKLLLPSHAWIKNLVTSLNGAQWPTCSLYRNYNSMVEGGHEENI